MFPPLVSPRAGSKGQYLYDTFSANNTSSPTLFTMILSKQIIINFKPNNEFLLILSLSNDSTLNLL